MNPPAKNPYEIVKRIVLGIIGMVTLSVGLYVGYLGLYTTSILSWNSPSGDWWNGQFVWLTIMAIFTVLAIAILYFILAALFIALAYPFLVFSINGVSLDVIFVKQIAFRLIQIIAPFIIMGVIVLIYSEYRTLDPHLGDFTAKDNYTFSLQYISATDRLYDCDVDTGSGWKFVVLRYYANNTGKEPIGIWPGSIVDENSISYSNYESECLPKADYNGYNYSKDIPSQDYRFGNFAYRMPMNAIPSKLTVMVNGDFITISLHKRQFILF
ncbi:MAG: hypothetical protein WCP70_08330 [Methanothrix sp.]